MVLLSHRKTANSTILSIPHCKVRPLVSSLLVHVEEGRGVQTFLNDDFQQIACHVMQSIANHLNS